MPGGQLGACVISWIWYVKLPVQSRIPENREINSQGKHMSETGLHDPSHDLHGTGEHGGKGGLSQWVAIMTALLATIGAIVSYQGSHLMNEVLLYKNESILKKAQATDQWNYYQAISTKGHLMELAQVLAPPDRTGQFSEKIKKYQAQKTAVKTRAEALDAASVRAGEESARLNRPHNDMALAMILLQIAISLASITALTQKKWLFLMAGLSAAGGIGLWLVAERLI